MMSIKVEASRRISLIPPYLTLSIKEVRETFVAWIRLGEFIARATDPVETRFRRLAGQWKNAVGSASDPKDICGVSFFHELVRMGDDILPLVMRELDADPFHWFEVLAEITGEDPTRPGDAGDVTAMTAAWKQWAEDHNIR
jgi:hypothetical protein